MVLYILGDEVGRLERESLGVPADPGAAVVNVGGFIEEGVITFDVEKGTQVCLEVCWGP